MSPHIYPWDFNHLSCFMNVNLLIDSGTKENEFHDKLAVTIFNHFIF